MRYLVKDCGLLPKSALRIKDMNSYASSYGCYGVRNIRRYRDVLGWPAVRMPELNQHIRSDISKRA